MRSILDSIFNINYVYAIVLIFVGYCIYEWINLIRNRGYYFQKETYTNLNTKQMYTIIERIKYMEGRDFEIFCAWLFKNCGRYNKVFLTPAEKDGGKDIILDDRIYVECKRYTENATVTEEFMIGREICQKLVGAMVGDGYKEGIIVTTGNIHDNAYEYIGNLERNSDIRINFITLDGIIKMVREIDSSEALYVSKLYEGQFTN